MSDSKELLPCPFCGGKAELEKHSGSWGYYPASATVVCRGCGASSKKISDKEELKKDREAMAVWYQQCAAENHKNATRFRDEGNNNLAFAWQKTAESCYSKAREWYARSQEV